MSTTQIRYQVAALRMKAAEDRCRDLAERSKQATAAIDEALAARAEIQRQQNDASREAGLARQAAQDLGRQLLAEVAAAPMLESFEPAPVTPVADFDDDIPF